MFECKACGKETPNLWNIKLVLGQGGEGHVQERDTLSSISISACLPCIQSEWKSMVGAVSPELADTLFGETACRSR